MPLPSSVRSLLPLLIGLVVGGVGVTMFSDSLPGREGSPEERANKLEIELKRAQTRVAALEAASTARPPEGFLAKITGRDDGEEERERRRVAKDSARRIFEDLRDGRPVNPEEIFRVTQPMIRDLAPLFDRMRRKALHEAIDSTAGEMARKYGLTPQQQELLRQWSTKRAEEEAKRWTELVGNENTRLEDLVRASQRVEPDDGLDAFMPGVLSADKLAAFRAERLAQRVKRVEQEADAKVQRLDAIVSLDETQRDQVFGIMARSSRAYDPSMVLEGSRGEIGPTPGGDPKAAMLSVLRPDQRARYDAERQRRRDEAAKEMESIGLALPPNWETLGNDFP